MSNTVQTKYKRPLTRDEQDALNYIKQVNDLVDIFDFVSVLRYFQTTGETYAQLTGLDYYGVEIENPDIYDLKALCRQMLQQAHDNNCEVFSGGFRAQKIKGSLRLSFCISELEVDEHGQPTDLDWC